MTGLPVANRPYDIWAQIYFLDHGGSLGRNFDDFKKKADLSNKLSESQEKQGEFENFISNIYEKISSFSIRETKNSGVIALPEKKFENIITSWEPRQLDLYIQIRDNLKAIILKEGLPKEEEAELVLKRLMRLVQVASNPRLIDDGYSIDPGKYQYLYEIVSGICGRNEKVVVWTTFTENADELCIFLKVFGACKVHGKLSIDSRNKTIDEFINEKNRKVLIATPGSAKEGLTLTVANHAIFYDRSFSLDDYLQAQDRIHRISQVRACYVYNLIMQDSIDQWIDSLLRAKELSALLTQGDISKEYFKTQISYSFTEILKDVLNIE